MLEIMSRRRSIRKFKPEKISEAEVRSLVDAGLLAPSGKNARPVELFVVQDKIKIEKLVECKDGDAPAFKTAPLAIVVTGSPEKSDIWAVDSAIAATHILLQAEAMRLGCCWIQIMNRRHGKEMAEAVVRRVLDIPSNLSILCVMAIGHADETKDAYSLEKLDRSRAHYL